MIRAFGWFTVYGFVVIVALALYDYLEARCRRWWQAYLARQLAPVLAEERRKHAADLERARQEHQEARAWLIETHRMEIAQREARVQQRITEAVVEAMTAQAPHPLRDVA
jgi:hypothetical protein